MRHTGAALLAALTAFALSACDSRSLRGSIEASQDGGTYLLVADDNDGGCDAIKVNGKVWPYALNRAGPVAPGEYVLQCGGSTSTPGIPIVIPEGMVFEFDYWGP